MFDGHRIVCVTPAGRRRYLDLLVPQILASPLVDEYHLWNNAKDPADVRFMREIQVTDSRIRVVEPVPAPADVKSIGRFYAGCVDPDTIYVRFNDDIVFIEPEFFDRFLRFRIDHPEFFVVFPNTINNAVCTYIQAARGAIRPGAWIHPWCMDVTAWGNPRFAEQLHRAFLASVQDGDLSSWRFGPRVIALARYSVNVMAWFGREFARFGGVVPGDEEEYVSVIKPAELMRTNAIDGDAIVSHFAFMPQRAYLDSTDLLSRYAAVAAPASTRPIANGAAAVARSRDLWTPRLLEAIARLLEADDHDLMAPAFVAEQIRHAGLVLDRRFLYGDDNRYMNTEKSGLWQMPMQLARFLVHLSRYDIASVADVGTSTGWTTAIVAAYLSRFNPDLRVVSVDRLDAFESYRAVKTLLPIEFRPGCSSSDLAGEAFDLAFLDAAHSFAGCRADYDAVGREASLCAIHDINDKFVAAHAPNEGGVPRFWRELSAATRAPDAVFEFLDHSHQEPVMGIGLIVRQSARPRATPVSCS